MRILRFLSLAAIAPLCLEAAAPGPSFSTARLSDMDRTLSSDAFQGRGPATPAEQKTIDYIVAQMKAAGLQPGGQIADGKRQWTQDVPLLRSEIVGQPQLALTIGGSAVALTQGNEIAVRAPLDGTKRVDIDRAPLVFVGYGVAAPERHWDDFKGIDLHGKIAVVLINDPDFETGEGAFDGKAMTYYGRWTYKYEELARRGAAGILIVHETAPAAYGWATVRNSNTNPQFDIVRSDPKAAHSPLEAWIQRDLTVKLFTDSGLDFDAMKHAAQGRDFRPVPLKTTLTAHYAADVGVIRSHNILGRLRGTTHPDETLLYTAHWDHLGVGAPDARGDRIYNGAVDNATGVSALIELGCAFAHAPRTERSIVFMAVTAEEKGLLGSEYYAANPVYPTGKTVADINMDALSVSGPARDFSMSGSAKLGLLDDLIAQGKTEALAFTPDADPAAGHFFRSDHFSFAKRGVPAISVESGRDLIEGGRARGDALYQTYVRDHYHQPSDEWQPTWNWQGVTQTLSLVYGVGRQLATTRAWPNWSPDSQFRVVRDKTAADRP